MKKLYKKIFLFTIILFICFGYSISSNLENNKNPIFGQEYFTTDRTHINLNPSNSFFYEIEKNSTVFCNFESLNKKYIFCSWEFSKYKKPIVGWIEKKTIREK